MNSDNNRKTQVSHDTSAREENIIGVLRNAKTWKDRARKVLRILRSKVASEI